jgi:hypothetical protein
LSVVKGVSCDVNEHYSCATGKKLFDIELEHCLMIMLEGKMPIYQFTRKSIILFLNINKFIVILNKRQQKNSMQ